MNLRKFITVGDNDYFNRAKASVIRLLLETSGYVVRTQQSDNGRYVQLVVGERLRSTNNG